MWCGFFFKKGVFTSDVMILTHLRFPSGDPEGLADHQQHRDHEGRGQGVLVRPHRRVSVLVQRRRGETLHVKPRC